MKRILSVLAVTALCLGGTIAPSWSQTSGWTIFGGVERKYELKYRLQRGKADTWDRYWLKIPAKKVNWAVLQFQITYPEYFDGEFDSNEIEVKVDDETIEIQDALWDPENRLIEIYPLEPIPANKDIEIVLSDVQNPRFGGMFNFNCRIVTPGGPPLPQYLGTWVLAID
jgi:hypothetical protein